MAVTVRLDGETNDGAGWSVSNAGDVNNDGFEDVIAGTSGNDVLKGTSAAEIFEAGAGDDNIRVADLGFASIDGGVGNDALHLSGSGLNLNLADFAGRINGIETICIDGRGDNTLTLTTADLLNLSNTSNTLKVHGNVEDRIVLDGDWVDGGNRGFYHTYTQDDVVLLVGMNLAADFA